MLLGACRYILGRIWAKIHLTQTKKVMPSTVEYCHIVNINKALLVTKQKMGEFCCMWHHSLLFIYFTNICGDDSVVKVIIMSAYSV